MLAATYTADDCEMDACTVDAMGPCTEWMLVEVFACVVLKSYTRPG